MKVTFNSPTALMEVFRVNDWDIFDDYEVDFDEVDGKKRIIIRKQGD